MSQYSSLYCDSGKARTVLQYSHCAHDTARAWALGRRWACRWALGERVCWTCRARARLGVLGAGAAGAGALGRQALRRWGDRRWGAQGERARGALAGARQGERRAWGRGAGGSGRAAGRTGAKRWVDWALGAGARGLRGRGRQRARHWQAGRAPGRAWCPGWASWGLIQPVWVFDLGF